MEGDLVVPTGIVAGLPRWESLCDLDLYNGPLVILVSGCGLKDFEPCRDAPLIILGTMGDSLEREGLVLWLKDVLSSSSLKRVE